MPSSWHAKDDAQRDFAAVGDQDFLNISAIQKLSAVSFQPSASRPPLADSVQLPVLLRPDRQTPLAVLHRLSVLDVDSDDLPVDSESISFINFIASMMQSTCPVFTRIQSDERRRAGLRRPVERPTIGDLRTASSISVSPGRLSPALQPSAHPPRTEGRMRSGRRPPPPDEAAGNRCTEGPRPASVRTAKARPFFFFFFFFFSCSISIRRARGPGPD